jgi:TonB family protein
MPQRVAAPAVAPTIIPVEVRSKPTPIYTDKARELKIEGDVVLEVEFLASGSLRVVRVVKGLGYGLDEAAMKAAEQIEFKPAHDAGRPVDFKTTVHIVFRLA